MKWPAGVGTSVLDYDRLLTWPFADVTNAYDVKECIFYALSLGLGSDPCDPEQLRFVYEENLVPMPTMALILGFPGPFLADPSIGADYGRAVHGEQSLVLHRPLPTSARVVSSNRVEAVVDKGVGRGALVYIRRETRDAESGEPISTQVYTVFCRGDGGFGGPSGPIRPAHQVPQSEPHYTFNWQTLPQASLLHRLLQGDRNPLHVDPKVARAAGFPRPIIHGLCTLGVAGLGLAVTLCGWEAERLRRIDARFVAPLFPGETVGVQVWLDDVGRASFRCAAVERAVTVIDNGYCEYTA